MAGQKEILANNEEVLQKADKLLLEKEVTEGNDSKMIINEFSKAHQPDEFSAYS